MIIISVWWCSEFRSAEFLIIHASFVFGKHINCNILPGAVLVKIFLIHVKSFHYVYTDVVMK